VRGLRFPSHVILRPASCVLHGEPAGAFQPPGLHAGLGARARHQAADDCGGRHRLVRARAFTDAVTLNRREIDLADDVQTMPEAAEILTEALGRTIAFAQTPVEQVQQYSKDMALVLQ